VLAAGLDPLHGPPELAGQLGHRDVLGIVHALGAEAAAHVGRDVTLAPVSVLHGNLTVQIVTDYLVSQPAALSTGQTVVTPQVNVQVKEEQARQVVLKEGANVEELIKALMAIGSTPRDIIAIMQGISAAGALDADLEVM
jgi:flagellar P-ring protein precursor FlgI